MCATVLVLSSCSTKLDVIGNYKETMVVYGLLDPSQSKQYIKINKAFLGEGNAIDFAKIKDSTQYVNSLSVKIIRLSDGAEFPLSPDNSIPKASGAFYGPDQANAIYSFSTPTTKSPNTSTSYAYDSVISNTTLSTGNFKLVVRNSETGKEVTSQTSLVGDAAFTSTNLTGISPSFTFVKPNAANWSFPVQWNSGKNARIYQTIIRFHYIDSTTTGNTANTLDWVLPSQKTGSLNGGEAMNSDFTGQSLLEFIGNQLKAYSGLIARKPGSVDVILVAGADDLSTFIDVNAPSTGIIQERPEFTNVTNGLGIFSSRYFKFPLTKPMDSSSLDSLACGQYTKGLKFLNRLGVLFCP